MEHVRMVLSVKTSTAAVSSAYVPLGSLEDIAELVS